MLYRTLLLSLAALAPAFAVEAPGESPEHKAQRLAWFREARFGMFIHWGVYAVPAGVYNGKPIGGIGEWIMKRGRIPVVEYRAFAPQFTAAQYDPEAWAALAKRAGMRYVVITAKHHDGFALYDTAVSDWSAVKAGGAKRDLLAPLAKAVRGQGLRFGLYYSQSQDWTHPGGAGADWDPAQKGDYDAYLQGIAVPQAAEILERYRPDMLWWDTPVAMTPARAAYFAPVLAKYPDLVTNNRLGGGVKGDLETPEQHIPPRGFPGRDFEVCMTMNDTWGYKSTDSNWKSQRQLLRNLSDIASKGGNFLLNIGPRADGTVPTEISERLEAMGRWMAVNGEAIHGTQASPFPRRLTWGRATHKTDGAGSIVYAQVWDWPGDGRLVLPHAGQDGASATLLAGGGPLATARVGEDLVVTLPAAAPDADVSVIRVHLPKALGLAEEALPVPGADGAILLSPREADALGNYQGSIQLLGSGADCHLGAWRDPGWALEYRVKTPAATRWLVKAEVATASPAALKLTAGKVDLPVSIAATGGEATWTTVELGQIGLPAGETSFTLRAEKRDWKGLNLRLVTLTPVQ